MLMNLIGIISGAIVGWLFYCLTFYLIKRRVPDKEMAGGMDKPQFKWIYTGLSVLGFGLICFILPNTIGRYETMLFFSICLSIGWIDRMIRKIPNEWLLILILCKTLFLLIDHKLEFLAQGMIGMAAGFMLFMLPSLLGISIGAGDIKYAAVVGFCLGAVGLIQVILIMALGLLVYLLYLLISKKGDLKTAAAIGPYISLGVLFTALFPLLS